MQVNLAFWSREAVAPDPHPPSKSIVGFLGTAIVRSGIGTGESRCWELFQVIRTSGGNAMPQSNERLSLKATRIRATMPQNTASVTDRLRGKRIEQILLELENVGIGLHLGANGRNRNGRTALHDYGNRSPRSALFVKSRFNPFQRLCSRL